MTEARAIRSALDILKTQRARDAFSWILEDDWNAMLDGLDRAAFKRMQRRIFEEDRP